MEGQDTKLLRTASSIIGPCLLINLSLSTGSKLCFKQAVVEPALKKPFWAHGNLKTIGQFPGFHRKVLRNISKGNDDEMMMIRAFFPPSNNLFTCLNQKETQSSAVGL